MRRLYKELENYGKSDFYPFHMPGHKRNKACIEGDFPIERDITEIDGFDDLHHSEGIYLKRRMPYPECTAPGKVFSVSTEVRQEFLLPFPHL